MTQVDIPVFLHDIVHLVNQIEENKPQEKCPVFNPHEKSDPNNKDELLIPNGELFVRQVLDF